jgi:hypothetical protein
MTGTVDPGSNFFDSPAFTPHALQGGDNDAIRRLLPPAFNPPFGGASAPGMSSDGSFLNGLLQQIGNMLQQLGSLLQFAIPGGNMFGNWFGGGGFGENERYFQNASGSSVGDPHLSFNGQNWDNMASQPDLLHSDSFQGGYQVSTQVTQPAQNGVTYNQSASVSTNYGLTNISLDNANNAAITQNGAQVSINVGQTIDLGGGETVTRTQNGLQITANNGMGGQITTTLTANGQGVDVQNSASNVDLGGALVQGQATPWPIHLPRPNPQPYLHPLK